MTMTPSGILLRTYTQMLKGLAAWLEKARDQVDNPDALMAARLAPDMFPLTTQIRFACLQAHEGGHRLCHQDFPAELDILLEEGRQGGDRPGTMADALQRIDEALAALDSFVPEEMDAGGDRPLALELPIGLAFDFDGATYVRDWALPQFYFHITMAYAILRQQGVELGKADYVAHMFAYRRESADTPG
ncbi:DUF1993 family protein [Maricaulis sp. W15]|uniref:DUF1993 domain-containing protein n=1 Tax=Maricaulis sp. W15 TaxID=1772333 RepID=UPI000AC73C24|nr:DUF1993 domain-containing protein [Maricaulis sp. W15]